MKNGERFKSLWVETTTGTLRFFGPDGEKIFVVLNDAVLRGASHTFPIWLDDSCSIVSFGMANVIKFEKFYEME